MGLIGKKTLQQFLTVYDELKKVNKIDLAQETTADYPHHLDPKDPRDLDYDDAYAASNAVVGTYGMGNFGEAYGDITNQGHYANLLYTHNPLEKNNITTFDDFATMYGFGDWWYFRDGTKINKFDQPDEIVTSQGAGSWSAKQKVVGHQGTVKEAVTHSEPIKHIKTFTQYYAH